MKRILLCMVLVVILAGCSQPTETNSGKAEQTQRNALTEPADLDEREFTIMTISHTVAEDFGLPLNVPFIGNPGEAQEDIAQRVFEEGMKTEMIYWGIKVFMEKAEEQPSLKDAYSASSQDVMARVLSEDDQNNVPEEVRKTYFPTYEEAVPMFTMFMRNYEQYAASK